MKLIIDSANIEKIKRLMPLGITNGITTNPTILHKEAKDRNTLLKDLASITDETLFVQLVGDSVDELVEDYKSIVDLFVELNHEYVIKVAINREGLEAMDRIKDINPFEQFLGTTIYSLPQAILAIISGCQYLAPYYNRMINQGIDAEAVISDIRHYIDDQAYDCTIVAASLKTSKQVSDALKAGAHTCTLDPDVLEAMMLDEIVEKDLKVFTKHHLEFNS